MNLSARMIAIFLCVSVAADTAIAQIAKKPAPPDSGSAAQKAVQLAESGHCDTALPLLKRATALAADKDLKRRIGFAGVRCAMTLNQRYQALDFLHFLDREFPHDPAVLYLAVHTFSDLSMQSSQELATVAPFSYQAQQLVAESFEVQGRWEDAEKEYRKILQENPQAQGIHYRLGRIILSKPETPTTGEDAKREFEAELVIDPSNAGAEYVLGELARQDQQVDSAIEHFTRAARLDAGFADAFLGLGMTLISEKRYSDAIPPLESAVKLQPGNPTVHYNLAVAYARAGRKEDAMRETALHKRLLDKIEQEKQKAAEVSQQRTSGETPKTDPPQ
jgi:tetratricopeptide (TPR) repeat protein